MKSRRPSVSSVALLSGVSLAVATLLYAGTTRGQAPGGFPPAGAPPAAAPAPSAQPMDGVRVLDIGYLLEKNSGFQASMRGLKTEFEAATKQLRADRDAIANLEAQLKKYVSGSPDFRTLDEQIVQKKADFQVLASKQQKEFRNRESEILAGVYERIQQCVRAYCEHNRIGLVMQFNGDPPNLRDPSMVLKQYSRPLIYVAPNRDITPDILDMLNKMQPQVSPAGFRGNGGNGNGGGGGQGVPVGPGMQNQ